MTGSLAHICTLASGLPLGIAHIAPLSQILKLEWGSNLLLEGPSFFVAISKLVVAEVSFALSLLVQSFTRGVPWLSNVHALTAVHLYHSVLT